MYCTNCGYQLPNDANFCLKCGRPQKAGVQVEEPRWETCEIEDIWGGLTLKAVAVGPSGRYIAAAQAIPPPTWSKHADTEEAMKNLANKLVSEGWEPVTNLRFRRRWNPT
jgi:hypothetical protein